MTLQSAPQTTQRANAGRLTLNVEEAAHVAGISRSTVCRLVKSGELRSVKLVGRRLIMRSDLEDLLRGKLEMAGE